MCRKTENLLPNISHIFSFISPKAMTSCSPWNDSICLIISHVHVWAGVGGWSNIILTTRVYLLSNQISSLGWRLIVMLFIVTNNYSISVIVQCVTVDQLTEDKAGVCRKQWVKNSMICGIKQTIATGLNFRSLCISCDRFHIAPKTPVLGIKSLVLS